jgi:dethiobiotin synthetase
MRAADVAPAMADDVTPILLREPMAPHIAAARENRRIDLEPVREAFLRISAEAQFVVVEGVGGFMVPLDDDLDTVDLARVLHLPVVLVVGMRLGCLNHALLTARSIAASGLPFAGWIANHVDGSMAVPDENVAALKSRLAAPLLGRFPYQARVDPPSLARLLDVKPLLELAS